jgi:hypothetical protein
LMFASAAVATGDEHPQVTLEPVSVSVVGDSMTIALDQPDRCSWQVAVDVILDKKSPPDAVIRVTGSRANPNEMCAQVITRTTTVVQFPVGAASVRSAEGGLLWVRPTRTTVTFRARAVPGQLIVTTSAATSPVPTRLQVTATAKGQPTLKSTLTTKSLKGWTGSQQVVLNRAVPRVLYKIRIVVQFPDGNTVTSQTWSLKAR